MIEKQIVLAHERVIEENNVSRKNCEISQGHNEDVSDEDLLKVSQKRKILMEETLRQSKKKKGIMKLELQSQRATSF